MSLLDQAELPVAKINIALECAVEILRNPTKSEVSDVRRSLAGLYWHVRKFKLTSLESGMDKAFKKALVDSGGFIVDGEWEEIHYRAAYRILTFAMSRYTEVDQSESATKSKEMLIQFLDALVKELD